MSRYNTLADYTVFSPAYPLEQSPHFINLMGHPSMLALVQTMSTRVSDAFPPRDVIVHHSQDPWFRSDRFSLRTLESVYFVDCCIHQAALQYATHFNLSDGANIMRHFFATVGLDDWVPERQELGSFSYGSIFGVAKPRIRRHPWAVYQKFYDKLQEHVQTAYLAERAWLILFGGPDYVDKSPEKWWLPEMQTTAGSTVAALA